MSKRRILSIDGGGIKGLYPASFLEGLMEMNAAWDRPLWSYFDLIAGTSTGAILAAGIAADIPIKKMVEFYQTYGKKIFSKPNLLGQIFTHKYSPSALQKALEDVFGDKVLGDCKTRLVIPSFELSTMKTRVFKTKHHPSFKVDYRKRLVDILMASAAAPTYFPARRVDRGYYLDGGIGANNPSAIAVIEAIRYCCWKPEDLYVLSLGCIHNDDGSLDSAKTIRGRQIGKLIELFMTAQVQYANHMARFLLEDSHWLRINTPPGQKRFCMDDAGEESCRLLIEAGHSAAQENCEKVRQLLFFCTSEDKMPAENTPLQPAEPFCQVNS